MFSLHDFVMTTIRGMIGHYPDFQCREYGLGWYTRGVLTEEDLAQIEAWIVEHNTPAEEDEEEETAEE